MRCRRQELKKELAHLKEVKEQLKKDPATMVFFGIVAFQRIVVR